MSAIPPRTRLSEAEALLSPGTARGRALAQLDDLFRSGTAPDPLPRDFLKGRPITATTWAPLDAIGRRVAALYMPWLGKSFDPAAGEGFNVLTTAALGPMKVLWPGYRSLRQYGDRVDAFPFTTRVAPGELDPQTDVLKIDYDSDANPTMIIRSILDELVQIDHGTYLGKVLYRIRSRFRRIGFFTLER
jgi:hypothetical protein